MPAQTLSRSFFWQNSAISALYQIPHPPYQGNSLLPLLSSLIHSYMHMYLARSEDCLSYWTVCSQSARVYKVSLSTIYLHTHKLDIDLISGFHQIEIDERNRRKKYNIILRFGRYSGRGNMSQQTCAASISLESLSLISTNFQLL